MIRTSLAVALLGLALAACSPQDPRQQASTALTDGVLLPAYASWDKSNQQLAASAKAFCAGSQDLATARQALHGDRRDRRRHPRLVERGRSADLC